MTFIFRSDSADFIGSGHIRRCLNIAREIKERGTDSIFICNSHKGNINREIKSAIIFVMPLVDKRMCGYLRAGYMQLGMFQPIDEIRVLNLPNKISSLSDKEIFSRAKKIQIELDKIARYHDQVEVIQKYFKK